MRLTIRCFISILLVTTVKCNEVQKYNNFNENLREYSDTNDYNVNSTDQVKTLQTEQLARYSHFVPSKGPIPIKDISDNALASSSHVKGFTPHSKIGYTSHDYIEHGPENGHYGYGYDYYIPNIHEVDHHDLGHGYGHHLGYHHHHKHYDHGLATKAILWPIAGIALLGAAAALVSNPILLQLGVVSGKRRRRYTEEDTGPDLDTNFLKNIKNQKTYEHNVTDQIKGVMDTESKNKEKPQSTKKRHISQDKFLKKEHRQNYVNSFVPYSWPSTNSEDEGLIPIPLQTKRKKYN